MATKNLRSRRTTGTGGGAECSGGGINTFYLYRIRGFVCHSPLLGAYIVILSNIIFRQHSPVHYNISDTKTKLPEHSPYSMIEAVLVTYAIVNIYTLLSR